MFLFFFFFFYRYTIKIVEILVFFKFVLKCISNFWTLGIFTFYIFFSLHLRLLRSHRSIDLQSSPKVRSFCQLHDYVVFLVERGQKQNLHGKKNLAQCVKQCSSYSFQWLNINKMDVSNYLYKCILKISWIFSPVPYGWGKNTLKIWRVFKSTDGELLFDSLYPNDYFRI